MSRAVKIGSLVVAAVCLATPLVAQSTHVRTSHKATKKALAPLRSGPLGPLPQFPLDSLPAVTPHVDFQDGQLTIDTPNSTLGDVLRAVHSQTLAEMEVPAGATDRVALHLGPGPAREVVATLLNGSRFNYVLLGAPGDPRTLTKVVLVAKAGADAPGPPRSEADMGQVPAQNQAVNMPPPRPAQAEEVTDNADADAADENADENADQTAVEQPSAVAPEPNPGVRTPQQMLQEMQQRQLQMQQGQGQGVPTGQPPLPPVNRQQEQ